MINKKKLSLIFFFMLFYAGINHLGVICTNNQAISKYILNIAITIVIISHFYVFSIYTYRRSMYILSSIVITIMYIYIFYITLIQYSSIVKIEDEFYIFLASIPAFLLSFFFNIKNSKDPEPEFISKKNNVDSLIDKKTEYLLGKYIFGIDKMVDICGHCCVASFSKKATYLNIAITANNHVVEYNIPTKTIIDISSMKRVIMDYQEPKADEYAFERFILASCLFGRMAPFVANGPLFDDPNNDGKVNFNEIYEVKVNYNLDGKCSTFMFETKQNPKTLFNSIGSNYIEK